MRGSSCGRMSSFITLLQPVQVEFESKILNRVSHLIGSRVETRRFQAMGKLDSTCINPPCTRA
jgi:hypothetical protein